MPKGDCAMQTMAGWSGWPGAFCLTCGREDHTELAIGDGNYDPTTDQWREGTKEQYDFTCPLGELDA